MNPPLRTGNGDILFADLQTLASAHGLWKSGLAEREAVFHLYLAQAPFGGSFAVAAGLNSVTEHLSAFGLGEKDPAFLRELTAPDGGRLFNDEFVDYLGQVLLTVDIDAMPEGTVAFPMEPLLRIRGPVLQCQLLEAALLNAISFPTLVATKAARVCLETRGEDVVEVGLRGAHGPDGALTASRAAYIGGCTATSNVLAGRAYGIPLCGAHSNSWVMLFEDEVEAFATYAAANPGNCIFLVDTYDTIEGVKHAIQIGRAIKPQGHKLVGIRIDSGDLAHFAKETRYLLNRNGMDDVGIFAGGGIDEHVIASLKRQGAPISEWRVGPRLVTAHGGSTLDSRYQVSAIIGEEDQWIAKLRLESTRAHTSLPGVQQVRRYYDGVECVADAIYDLEIARGDDKEVLDLADPSLCHEIPSHTERKELLQPVMREGSIVHKEQSLKDIRRRTKTELKSVSARCKRLLNPQPYLVGLDRGLAELRDELIAEARGEELDAPPDESLPYRAKTEVDG